MTSTTLDDNISALERILSRASDQEKATLARRLHDLLNQKRPPRYAAVSTADEDEDFFDNMPV